MSELHIRQIRAACEKTYSGLIDLSDVNGLPDTDRQSHFLTRALAALVLAYAANVSPEDAAAAITDGPQDNGLDGIYFHQSERVLYLLQSKWKHNGSGSIDRGDMGKFLRGVRDLLNARWERFNPRVSAKSSELNAALDDASIRIVLIVAHTGSDLLAREVEHDLRADVDELNDPAELVSCQVFRQGDVYAAVKQGAEGAPIDLDVALYDWGQVREPYTAFYGQVSASDVAGWFSAHQNRLLAPNIRLFLGATEVNETILETLSVAPADFWYFNNGITVLCKTLRKKPIGGNTRDTGVFECRDLRVVNGAQTVGAIAQAATRDADCVARARVLVRIISLENAPERFDKKVTRYTNTQNRIDRRDFVSLDPEQERLKSELQLEGVFYAFKSGDTISSPTSGFDVVEATVALACKAVEVSLAVQAKREVGKLWDDISRPPYKVLFNAGLSGPSLWRTVQVLRQVENELDKIKHEYGDGRERLLAVHGNRFIAHLVFAYFGDAAIAGQTSLSQHDDAKVRDVTRRVFSQVFRDLDERFPEAYLASLFKNASKCDQLRRSCSLEGSPTGQLRLLPPERYGDAAD